MKIFIKYDLRSPHFGAGFERIYETFLDQCAWADSHGFHGVRLHEHHGSDDGYLPSPLVAAGAVAGRTRTLTIRNSVLVLPLYDPIRVAEDLAVLDLMSRGRLELVVAAGYAADEFEMLGKNVADRVELLTRNVGVLRQAWTGEEFEFEGRKVKVRPVPFGGRQIPIALGGSSVRAARQAARIADGFEPAPRKFLQSYLAECERLEKKPGWSPGPGHELRLLHVARDPERAWEQMKTFAKHENDWYAALTQRAGTSVGYLDVPDADALRAQGAYRVVTPEECLEIVTELGPDGEVQLHPLMGGMDPDLGWESLYLFHSEVMPRLAERGWLRG